MRNLLGNILASVLAVSAARAADWPMYRADAARSGYTPEALPKTLALAWSYQAPHPPQPAWPTSDRLTFDRAYQPVIAKGLLYFASSTDDQVYALDAATGALRWTRFTDAPVRFAPVIWQDRLFVTSDDGWLYCLSAADGQVRWKFFGGSRSDLLLGNDRLISRWPARGGPVVVDGIIYFGAGIWPSEGIFLHALDAATGKPRWCNDSAGALEMNQPHGGARAKSGIAAQGYFAAAGDTLLVPTGRAVPAAFERDQAALRYFHLQANRGLGGAEVAIIDGYFFNSGATFALSNGAALKTIGKLTRKQDKLSASNTTPHIQVAAHPRWIIYSTGRRLAALDRRQPLVEKEGRDAKGKTIRVHELSKAAWQNDLPADPLESLIVAGETVVGGGRDQVLLFDAASGRSRWSAKVRGTVWGLAVAEGRLYASTDAGWIYCFAQSPGMSNPGLTSPARPPVFPAAQPAYAAAAEEILRASGVTNGYCLDLACGEGQLALELARRTKLRIYGVEADPLKVQAARQRLDAAGLYGMRVTIHQADPATVPYPNYFADLVVSGRSVLEGTNVVPRSVAARAQRPCGGIACLGPVGSMQPSVRGPLAGAGVWTHLYADAANTLCSGDTRLHEPLEMLWFRDTDLLMPNRHGRSPAPLVADGRMFLEGLETLRAVNLYNGTRVWEFPLPESLKPYHQDHLTGVAATGGNLCLEEEAVYLRAGQKCLVLNARTGRKTAEWAPPPQPDGKPGTWGYLAVRSGTIFGTLANRRHQVKESWRSFLGKLDMSGLLSEAILLFALESKTGQIKWTFAPEHSIRHNAIVVGTNRIYVVDRPVALADTPKPAKTGITNPHPMGRLVCLDSQTGKVLWERRDDIFGTLLALSEPHDVLLMAYQPSKFKLDSEVGDRLAAYRASDGQPRWSVASKYQSRPLLIDRSVYAEPGQWDLLTGAPRSFQLSRSYGCGILAASSQLLVFRSATLGYVDLDRDEGTQNYGGIRPGCWVNAIPAGGLLLLGEAASGCTCSYLNQATIALQPRAP